MRAEAGILIAHAAYQLFHVTLAVYPLDLLAARSSLLNILERHAMAIHPYLSEGIDQSDLDKETG